MTWVAVCLVLICSVASIGISLAAGQCNDECSVPGPPGRPGKSGPAGPKGDSGVRGNTGVPGRDGLKGTRGIPGPVGPQGNAGVNGRVGSRGATGSKGQKGTCDCYRYETDMQKLGQVTELGSNGWRLNRHGSLWYAHKLFREQNSYYAARTKCIQQGATLACNGMRIWTIRSKIEELVREAGENNVWIGLNDLQRQGRYVWEDGVQSTGSNTEWGSGEPNIGYERCAEMNIDIGYLLNDVSCTDRHHYLCEKVF